jgi:hypothetical protein
MLRLRKDTTRLLTNNWIQFIVWSSVDQTLFVFFVSGCYQTLFVHWYCRHVVFFNLCHSIYIFVSDFPHVFFSSFKSGCTVKEHWNERCFVHEWWVTVLVSRHLLGISLFFFSFPLCEESILDSEKTNNKKPHTLVLFINWIIYYCLFYKSARSFIYSFYILSGFWILIELLSFDRITRLFGLKYF